MTIGLSKHCFDERSLIQSQKLIKILHSNSKLFNRKQKHSEDPVSGESVLGTVFALWARFMIARSLAKQSCLQGSPYIDGYQNCILIYRNISKFIWKAANYPVAWQPYDILYVDAE